MGACSSERGEASVGTRSEGRGQGGGHQGPVRGLCTSISSVVPQIGQNVNMRNMSMGSSSERADRDSHALRCGNARCVVLGLRASASCFARSARAPACSWAASESLSETFAIHFLFLHASANTDTGQKNRAGLSAVAATVMSPALLLPCMYAPKDRRTNCEMAPDPCTKSCEWIMDTERTLGMQWGGGWRVRGWGNTFETIRELHHLAMMLGRRLLLYVSLTPIFPSCHPPFCPLVTRSYCV